MNFQHQKQAQAPDPLRFSPRERSPRIQAGFAKGMVLFCPSGQTTRPTRARMRCALWDSLQAEIVGARVLDLFSGSGSLGIEALSRGAAHVTFVEKAPHSLAALKKNLLEVERRAIKQGIQGVGINLSERGVISTVQRLRPEERFDIVCIDPPFAEAKAAAHDLAPLLDKHLSEDAAIFFETPLGTEDAVIESFAAADKLALSKKKYFGVSVFLLFRMKRVESQV